MESDTPTPVTHGAMHGYREFGFLRLVPGLYRDALGALTRITAENHPIVHFSLGKKMMFLLNHPDLFRHVLKTNYLNFPRGATMDAMRPFLGNSIFTSNNGHWPEQHKMLNSGLHNRALEQSLTVLYEELERAMHRWDAAGSSGAAIDIQLEMKRLMMRALFRPFFVNEMEDELDDMLRRLDEIQEYTCIRSQVRNQVMGLLTGALGIKHRQKEEFTDNIAACHAYMDAMIDDCLAGKRTPGVIMQVLLEYLAQGKIDRVQARDDISAFLFAGFDTVAQALFFCLYLLAENPAELAKVREEASGCIGSGYAGWDDCPKLEYLKLNILEALRLYPPAWAMFRIATEQDVVGGYLIPQNEVVMISPYLFHRNPAWWQEPLAYKPERFTGMPSPESGRYDYIPFGQGPHICIGKKAAILQLQALLSTIVLRYDFTFPSAGPLQLVPHITIKTPKPMWVKVKKRVQD